MQIDRTAQEKKQLWVCKDGNPNMAVLTARFIIHSMKSQIRIQKLEDPKGRTIHEPILGNNDRQDF